MIRESRWRLAAQRVIGDVRRECPKNTSAEDLAQRIRAAYPFGERKYYPYKIWCEEVNLYFEQKRRIAEYEKQYRGNLC